MSQNKVSRFARFAQTAVVLISVFSLLTCTNIITDDLLFLVADELEPELSVSYPQFGSAYISIMTIVGNISDSSEVLGDKQGGLSSLSLSFLDAAQYNRTVFFGDDGFFVSSEPTEPSFFRYDPEAGNFEFDFGTEGLSNNIYLGVCT